MIKDIFKMEKEGKIEKTYYLIDFENVGSDGLKGCDQLKKADQIHLFYTNNANKISLDVFSRRGEAELYVHKVPVKNQSLDMHLVSYLGYLIGINGDNCAYVIISKDTDFDNIIKFWQEEHDTVISRAGRIVPDKKAEKKAAEKAAAERAATEKIAAEKAAKPEKKPKKKLTDILSLKSEAKIDAEATAAAVTPTEAKENAAEATPESAAKADAQPEVAPKKKKKKKKPKAATNATSENITPEAREISPETREISPDEKTQLNNQVQKALAAAGKPGEVISYVTSVAMHHAGAQDGKQSVYRTMVAEYGQAQGRDIYNRIRKYI
jgi:hypothetical protein